MAPGCGGAAPAVGPRSLLHGDFDDSRGFEGNLARLDDSFTVILHDRRGQGRSPDAQGPITQHRMAEDAVAVLGHVADDPVRLVGYSDGAVVALLLALRRPDLVERVVLISGVWARQGWLAAPDPHGEPDVPAAVVDAYAEVSPGGRGHFPVVARKLATYSGEDLGITTDDLAGVRQRVLVVAADDDILDAVHTLSLFRALPRGELAVVPGTSHGLLQEKPELVTRIVRDFLTQDPWTRRSLCAALRVRQPADPTRWSGRGLLAVGRSRQRAPRQHSAASQVAA